MQGTLALSWCDRAETRGQEVAVGKWKSGAATGLALAAWLVAAAPGGAYTVYVTNEKDNTVTIIDSAKLEAVRTVKVGQRPRGVILSKDHKWLLICASDDNNVQVFDARTMEYVKTL